MNYSTLKDGGIYQLAEDVENPHADRRYKRQVNKAPLWKKGTRFVARLETYERDFNDGRVLQASWFKLEWIDHPYGSMYGISVNERDLGGNPKEDDESGDQARAIMAQLAPAAEDYKAFVTRIGLSRFGSETVLQQLCEKGIVTRDQIEVEYNIYMGEPDE